MEKLSLKGRVAIITGSSSGIGAATALLFVQRGACVTIHGRNTEKLERVKAQLLGAGGQPNQILTVSGDICEARVRERLVSETIQKFERLDILVNNAGYAKLNFIRDVTEDILEEHMSLFLKAPVFTSQLALPHLIKTKGNIVNVSTTMTKEVYPGFFPYSAAKVGLDLFTQYACVEFSKVGVRVNCVRPGLIVTPIFDAMPPAIREVYLAEGATCSVFGRNGTPDEVAQLIAFYASDAASYLTGSLNDVDGGRLLYRNRDQKHPEPKYDDMME